jgi:hypothetical protein
MFDEGNASMMDYGLSNDEVRELQEQLDAAEFAALLEVQRQLLDAPMVAPAADFTSRVMIRLAAVEQRRARRHNSLGAIGFMFGTLIVGALGIWSSPLGTLVQVSGWAALLDSALSLFNLTTTSFVIVRSFANALLGTLGSTSLVLFAFLTLALTLIWTRMVTGSVTLQRSKIA